MTVRKLAWLAAVVAAMGFTQASARVGDTADKAKDTASSAGQDVKEGSQQAWDKTKETGEKASDKTQEAGKSVEHGAAHASAQAQGMKSVSGTVKSIEGDKLTLENSQGKRQHLQLGSDTKFMRNGKSISRDQLQEGERVRAAYSGSKDAAKASLIEVLESGHSGAKSKSEPSTR